MDHKAKEQDGKIMGSSGTDREHMGTPIFYAPYVELGTGPVGETTPVGGKYPGPLAYTQKGWTYYNEKGIILPDGRVIYFIHTRGQPARPFLYPAEQAHAKELPDNIKKAAETELRGLAK